MRTWKRVREDGNDQKWKDIDGSEETFTGKGKDGNGLLVACILSKGEKGYDDNKMNLSKPKWN